MHTVDVELIICITGPAFSCCCIFIPTFSGPAFSNPAFLHFPVPHFWYLKLHIIGPVFSGPTAPL